MDHTASQVPTRTMREGKLGYCTLRIALIGETAVIVRVFPLCLPISGNGGCDGLDVPASKAPASHIRSRDFDDRPRVGVNV